MKETTIKAFVEVVKNYFAQFAADDELVVDTPYLSEDKKPHVYDYTGVIGISGVMRGVVCVTASTDLLQVLLRDMDESDKSENMMVDLVGEIANTVAGNARREFGSEFHISTPFVFKGAPQSVVLPKEGRAFIIPVLWQKQVGEIIVCLEAGSLPTAKA